MSAAVCSACAAHAVGASWPLTAAPTDYGPPNHRPGGAGAPDRIFLSPVTPAAAHLPGSAAGTALRTQGLCRAVLDASSDRTAISLSGKGERGLNHPSRQRQSSAVCVAVEFASVSLGVEPDRGDRPLGPSTQVIIGTWLQVRAVLRLPRGTASCDPPLVD